MRNSRVPRMLTLAITVAVLLSLLFPAAALADDALPPTGEMPADPALPADEAAPGEGESSPDGDVADQAGVAEGEEAANLGDDPADEWTLPAEPDVAGETPPSDPAPAPAEIIDQAPEGTVIAVVDAGGEVLPLASEQAAEILSAGDPVWCPASLKAPTPGAGGCSPSFGSFNALLTYFIANQPTVDGIIWFEDDYDSGIDDPGATSFTLDGFGYATMSAYKLTLRGGWSGTSGDKTIDTSNPSEFNGRLRIVNWGNDVTLSDFVFTATTGTQALEVGTTGNITLTRIQSTGNSGRGAYLHNNSGSGKVKVSDSRFTTNAGADGLYVLSSGPITLDDVIASGNTGGNGVTLDNSTSLSNAGITLTGLNEFNDNYTTGLYIATLGAVTGKDLTVTGNGTSGFAGSGMQVFSNLGGATGGLTLTGTNVFSDNFSYGLYVYTNGAIKLSSVIANNNAHGHGALLDNASASAPQAVVLSGTNTFKYNRDYGLYVTSLGAITANNLAASGNTTGTGASLNNIGGAGVTVSGANSFYDNSDSGLSITSQGVIKASNITASGNGLAGGGNGASLVNSGATTAKSVTVSGTNLFTGNQSGGLYIGSAGAISVKNLTANGSINGTGAHLNNNAAASAQKVTLSGKSVFRDNYNTGLQIFSLGAITVSNLTASGNGLPSGSGTGVMLDNAGAASAQPVKLTGSSLFEDNRNSGLVVYSRGPISTSNLTATGNGVTNGQGVSLDNWLGAGASVKLTGTNVFIGNYAAGLVVTSAGPVSLSSASALDTVNGDGVSIINNTGSPDIAQKVSLSGSHVFSGNHAHGLYIYSYGAISLSSTVASGNGTGGSGPGVYLSNAASATLKGVTLSGTFTFNDNQGGGLAIGTTGPIKIKNLSASGNAGAGASLATLAAAVSVGGKNLFNGNEDTGLYIWSEGPITVSNVTANSNGWGGWGNGLSIDNMGAASAQKVSLSGTNAFLGNADDNLLVYSNGPITLNNVTASGSVAGYGAYIANDFALYESPVTISGIVAFNENWRSGLIVSSFGTVSLKTKTLEASGNGVSGSGGGVSLNNYSAPSPRAVSVKGRSIFLDNSGDGLAITSKGSISASHLTANNNAGTGAHLVNETPGAVGKVSLTGTNSFFHNDSYGLAVYSYGSIAVSNLTANGNGQGGYGYGAYLNNVGAPSPQDVNLTGFGIFEDNYTMGLSIASLGAITARNITATGTQNGSGANLSNASGTFEKNISLGGANVFTDNYVQGLEASSLGTISLSNVTASQNGQGGSGFGAVIDNSSAPTPQAVKLTGTNTFNNNRDTGLYIYSAGAISANNLTSYANLNGDGVWLRNNLSGSTAGISLTGTSTFIGNGNHGLYMRSNGAVSLTRATSSGNANRGWYVQNASSVTLTCGVFTNNGTYGAYLTSTGLMKLIGFFASGNPSGDLIWGGGGTLEVIRNCPYS